MRPWAFMGDNCRRHALAAAETQGCLPLNKAKQTMPGRARSNVLLQTGPSRQVHVTLPDSPDTSSSHPAGLEIGAAGWRDLPAIAGVQRRAFPPRFAYTLSTLAILRALPWVHLLVARRNGEIVGCVIGDRVLEGNRIVNLAVDPAAQRQGIGAALLHAAERTLPAGDMTLMVQTGNAAARALYHRVGYEEESVNPHYYGPGRPGIKMRKRRA